ncbi:Mu transposase C-terminal domain-containing protein, partial [Enterobacter intestinihominis]
MFAGSDLMGVGADTVAVRGRWIVVHLHKPVMPGWLEEPRDRQPIGRPYLTLAIDVFTRCVLGMVVTLEAP